MSSKEEQVRLQVQVYLQVMMDIHTRQMDTHMRQQEEQEKQEKQEEQEEQ